MKQKWLRLGGPVHITLERANGTKLGELTLKTACPLSTRKTDVGVQNMRMFDSTDDYGATEKGLSRNEKSSGRRRLKKPGKSRARTECNVWTAILAAIVFMLLVTLAMFIMLIKEKS